MGDPMHCNEAYEFHLLAVGDVKHCEVEAARHQCCPGVSWQVGVAVDVQVLLSLSVVVTII